MTRSTGREDKLSIGVEGPKIIPDIIVIRTASTIR